MKMFGYAAIVFVGLIFNIVCYEDSYDVKRMLEKLTEQNKQLEKKFETITAGLTDMCRAVNLATCDCRDADKSRTENVQSDEDLKLLSLECKGEVDDSVDLTVKFEASNDYGLEWFQMFNRGSGMVRSPGQLSKIEILNGRYLYTSDVQINDLNFTRQLFVRIYSLKNAATISLNLTALRESGERQFKDIKYKITQYQPKVILPADITEEYNLTINVARNIMDLVEKRDPGSNYRPNYYLTFINSTDAGNSIAEVYGDPYISLSRNDNGIGDIQIVFTLQADLLENGGIFSLLLPQTESHLIDEMWYGVVIQLLRKDRTSVVPESSVAVFNQNEHIYADSSSVSVFCFTMGNPKPNVTISKVQKSGLRELKTDIIIDDNYTLLRSATLRDSNRKGKALVGTYTCEASNGQETVVTNTIVHRYESVKFDERKTSVMVNTTKKVVVSCKASGNPTPKLEIRLGDMYGPNLLEADGNFTSKVSSKRDTSKAVITFSPVDDRFDVVYCVALQDDHQLYEMFEKEIRIFRDKSATDGLYDKYTFYESFRKYNYP